MSAIRLLIADDQYVTRSGLTAMAQNSENLSVAGEAHDRDEALEAAASLAPDIVLVNLRSLNGAELRELVSEIDSSPVIVLRSEGSVVGLEDALQAEVAGFADLDALESDLAEIVAIVSRGYSVCVIAENHLSSNLSPSLTADELEPPEWFTSLTDREVEVLTMMARGMTNRVIAAHLHVTEATVKKHGSRIMRKLGVSSRTEAALRFSRLENRNQQ